MNIVEPYAKLIRFGDELGLVCPFEREHGIALLKRIEWCGRISHRSEESQGGDSWERFIRAVVLGHGDWSIVEHAVASVDMLVDRGITHELVRHRLFSFTQESTRFVNYEKKMPASFIRPEGLSDMQAVYWRAGIEDAERRYKDMLTQGCAPQVARSVFPNALASRVIVTGNLRNWRHFLVMRTCREAHPQMRQVTIPLLAEFQEKIPILFEDIVPNAKQSEAIKTGR